MKLSWNERRKMARYKKQVDRDERRRVKEAEREQRREEKVWDKQWRQYYKYVPPGSSDPPFNFSVVRFQAAVEAEVETTWVLRLRSEKTGHKRKKPRNGEKRRPTIRNSTFFPSPLPLANHNRCRRRRQQEYSRLIRTSSTTLSTSTHHISPTPTHTHTHRTRQPQQPQPQHVHYRTSYYHPRGPPTPRSTYRYYPPYPPGSASSQPEAEKHVHLLLFLGKSRSCPVCRSLLDMHACRRMAIIIIRLSAY